METTKHTTEIKAYSVKELCNLYQVSYKTFSRWLQTAREDIGERPGRFYTVLQVEKIFSEFGIPPRMS